jgi:hypothetical protein
MFTVTLLLQRTFSPRTLQQLRTHGISLKLDYKTEK